MVDLPSDGLGHGGVTRQHAAGVVGGGGGVDLGGQAGHFGQGAWLLGGQLGVFAVHKTVDLRCAARVTHHLTFEPTGQHRLHLQRGKGVADHRKIFGMGVAADHDLGAHTRLHEFDHAVARVAQPHGLAHFQQAFQAGV